MRRFIAVLLIFAGAFTASAAATKPARAGGVTFGLGIGYGYPVFRPRYYDPGFYGSRYYGSPYYRPRYYRPRVYRYRRYRPRVRRRVVRRRLSPAHYAYCGRRYRSYRAYDNTFQPYRGRRKQCRSRY